jgi:RNA polymerase sigma factor (TIGR02999 family)
MTPRFRRRLAACAAKWHRSSGEIVTDITAMLGKARSGDRAATDALFASLYGELRRLALGQLRGDGREHATSLVHEAYEKFIRHGALDVADREHFFAIAARAMRQIVLDHVRSRGAQRRGGSDGAVPIETTALEIAAHGRDDDVLALDAALGRLAETDAALAEIVELRFYGGLELAEIASLRDRSERSLKRDWRRARAFLYRELGGTGHDDAD